MIAQFIFRLHGSICPGIGENPLSTWYLPLFLIPALLPAQTPAPDKDPRWILTFDDEFNGAELDLLHWSPHDPWGHVRDRQLQAFAPESVSVSAGRLHLIAQRTDETKTGSIRRERP